MDGSVSLVHRAAEKADDDTTPFNVGERSMRPQTIGFDPPANIETTNTNADDAKRIFKKGGHSTDTLSEEDGEGMSPSEEETVGDSLSMPPTATHMSANAKSLLASINSSKPSNQAPSTAHETPDVVGNASHPTSTPPDANQVGTSPDADAEKEDGANSDTDSDDLFIGGVMGMDEPHTRGPVMSDTSPSNNGKVSPNDSTDSITGLGHAGAGVVGKKRKALGEVAKDEDELSIASLIEDDNEDTSKLSPAELEQRLERM